ncbi:MAG: alpha-1,4-glucan--maltose-1-phosphate maltosyltransferase [Candidatus Dormibacteraeota bacterium]|nr:alpha-1,4-glucan--maltose-1-phosphate maltosyltransferase [Candidatus Dormibacteraeota bacterium]MBO0761850.1 alpha-1,4-glucan--maltose-1-phosphate maltosyltransferase [Candidatus Dormibacteraeota bacterium]
MGSVEDGRRRVVIEHVDPEIDGGRFPVKRVVGEIVHVEADVFADGHDHVAGVLLHCPGGGTWREVPLEPLGNDRWRASFCVEALGRHRYTLEGWIDHFGTWADNLRKRIDAGQDVAVELRIGAELVREAAERAGPPDRGRLERFAASLEQGDRPAVGLDVELAALVARHPDRTLGTRYDRELEVVVERERARFSAWYELFPRSAAPQPGRHGTFKDVEARLPYVAGMGFDVLYLPPIHPIGRSFRKGRDNALHPQPGDPGSPWAIGAAEGGHTAVHPDLGTLEDFRSLVRAAQRHGLEVALDVAFQSSPDHPFVAEHPDWYRWRPDGTVQYAENPPKKYQDIYPFNFETPSWRTLWQELKGVFEFWIEQGVRIFRVDNPHTKPFAFWEWLIGELRREHPDLIFLSEAFTRPKVMYRLAKLGFTQSYTYFAWRNQAWELREYLTELTRTEVQEYFRPAFWPNTPDILTELVQQGGRPASALRLVLAATLSSSYGIYGPVFELVETAPLEPGKEEYLHSEKYETRYWDLGRAQTLRELITRVNAIRRTHPALQQNRTLRFLNTDNDLLLAYAKTAPDGSDVVVTVVNLDPRYTQSGWVEVPVQPVAGLPTYQVEDLLNGPTYTWRVGDWNYVELNPATTPAHILAVGRPLVAEA